MVACPKLFCIRPFVVIDAVNLWTGFLGGRPGGVWAFLKNALRGSQGALTSKVKVHS